MLGTIKAYVRTAAQLMAKKFEKLGSNLAKLEIANNWMSKIMGNVDRLVMQRAFKDGTEITGESSPLHLHHVKAIAAKLTKANSKDGAFRKLVIMLSFMACGRCGEVVSVAWYLLKWNYALGVPVITWRDFKNSKDKPVVLLCSLESSDGDILIAFGDAAAHNQFNGCGISSCFLFSQFLDINS
jgi:hypothetical protein